MTIKHTFALVALLAVSVPQFARAQSEPSKFEITPFAGYRFGGSFDAREAEASLDIDDSNAFGILLNGYVKPDGQWEVLYARQETGVDTRSLSIPDTALDIDIEYIQAGGTYLFDGERLRPFVAMTIGLSRFAPQLSEYDTENFFGASIGAGFQFNAKQRIGIRVEARAFTTLLDNDSEIFCESDGGSGNCLIRLDGTILTQWQLHAGVVMRF